MVRIEDGSGEVARIGWVKAVVRMEEGVVRIGLVKVEENERALQCWEARRLAETAE